MDDVIHPCELNLTGQMSGGKKKKKRMQEVSVCIDISLRSQGTFFPQTCVCSCVRVCVAGVQ